MSAQRWPGSELITLLLQQYRDDRRFVADLQDLAHRHRRIALRIAGRDGPYGGDILVEVGRDGTLTRRDGSADADPAITAYWADFSAFVDRWQLAQLPEYCGSLDGRPGRMHARVHAWIRLILSSRWFAPGSLPIGTTRAVGPQDMPDPSLQVVLEGTWFPMHERQADAKARLLAACEQAIDRSLDRIAHQWEAVGWEFPDVRGQRETQVAWLYRRLVYRDSPVKIAAHDPHCPSPATVRNRTDELAARLGITLPPAR